ncbi:MAG: SemiSWEET family sugar transporter [Bosea sp. (in: a-proteobacteria)]
MNWITAIGFGAALCSTVSFVPQAWRIVRTRDTSALSAPMYVITTIGFLLWLIYGIMKGEWPLIITNAICFLLAGFILAMTLASPKQKAAVSDALQ